MSRAPLSHEHDGAPEIPERNPDLGRAVMWGTVILMALATWAAIFWAVLA
jgi:hypothetical protein